MLLCLLDSGAVETLLQFDWKLAYRKKYEIQVLEQNLVILILNININYCTLSITITPSNQKQLSFTFYNITFYNNKTSRNVFE